MLFHQLSMGSHFGFKNKRRGWRGEGASTQVCFIDWAQDGGKPVNMGMNNALDRGGRKRRSAEAVRWIRERHCHLERRCLVVSSHLPQTNGSWHLLRCLQQVCGVCMATWWYLVSFDTVDTCKDLTVDRTRKNGFQSTCPHKDSIRTKRYAKCWNNKLFLCLCGHLKSFLGSQSLLISFRLFVTDFLFHLCLVILYLSESSCGCGPLTLLTRQDILCIIYIFSQSKCNQFATSPYAP